MSRNDRIRELSQMSQSDLASLLKEHDRRRKFMYIPHGPGLHGMPYSKWPRAELARQILAAEYPRRPSAAL